MRNVFVLFPLATVATAVSVVIASVAASTTNDNYENYDFARNNAKRMTITAATKTHGIRRLEDSSSVAYSYTYLNDLSSYKTQFGKCLRIKVQENNDDDAKEGNSHFYNGNYHAQYKRYASFFLCSDDKNGQCGSCDESIEYITYLDTYLDSSAEYIQTLCGNCAKQCGRRDLLQQQQDRQLEYTADCSTCTSLCATYDNSNTNEFNYLDCQKAFVDEETGVQYYSAAACDTNEDIYIGVFYDNACTIKSKKSLDVAFTYNNFKMVQSMCTDCTDANDLCKTLYGGSWHCLNGNNQYGNMGNDDMAVCKTFKEASMTRTYKKISKAWQGVPFFVILFAFVVVTFTMGSYTYYIRHRAMKIPLADQDGTLTLDKPISSSDVPVVSSGAVMN